MLFQISFCFILVSLTLNSASKLETVEQINVSGRIEVMVTFRVAVIVYVNLGLKLG
jgi:hypothetical protein